MRYIKVGWRHNNSRYPVVLYSELDDDAWEVRKVELYLDGSMGYASGDTRRGDTKLGLIPTPPLGEIAADSEFDPSEISAEEFESVWSRATEATAN